MAKQQAQPNQSVTDYLNGLKHPLREQIEALRLIVLAANSNFIEDIKWNAPNYSINGQDRVTMKIHPPKNIMLILHCGAKTTISLTKHLIDNPSKLLVWKGNDRAVITFKDTGHIKSLSKELTEIINEWLDASL